MEGLEAGWLRLSAADRLSGVPQDQTESSDCSERLDEGILRNSG